MSKKKTNLYFEKDADINVLKDKIVCIVGYGNQGRSQALNLKDHKVNVIIGNKPDNYKKRAEKDGFKAFDIPEAVKACDACFLLIPDESMPKTYKTMVEPNLKKGAAIVFASGYNIAFGLIKPREDLDVLMIAPRMIGLGVRERYLNGEGFFSFVCVHQDGTSNGMKMLLALSMGIGTLKKGGIEVTMKQEAILDLFNEQAFGPAFGRVLLTSIDVLIKNGLPPEAVLCEMYMSEEMAYTYKAMSRIGLVSQVNLHSHTSQYGSMSRGIKYLGLGKDLNKRFQKTFDDINSGSFAKEWSGVMAKLKFKVIKYFAMKQKINKIEKKVRKNLHLPQYDVYNSPEDIDELLKKNEFKSDVNLFKDVYDIKEEEDHINEKKEIIEVKEETIKNLTEKVNDSNEKKEEII